MVCGVRISGSTDTTIGNSRIALTVTAIDACTAVAPASTARVPEDLAQALAANPKAAAFFETLTGANRYAVLYRIGAVKRLSQNPQLKQCVAQWEEKHAQLFQKLYGLM